MPNPTCQLIYRISNRASGKRIIWDLRDSSQTRRPTLGELVSAAEKEFPGVSPYELEIDSKGLNGDMLVLLVRS